MTIRVCKISVVACSFFFLLFVVFNNTTDYDSNYQFVRHVLSMDTTFPGNSGMWRALASPVAYRIFYGSIIIWEAVAAALIGAGAWRLWRARAAPSGEWGRAKTLAAAGLTVSLVQWYFAFITVGGEWFLMWQSKIWNGQEAALRMFVIMGISLVFLCLRDDEP
jgi:predicted small integral membrane protein